MRSEILRPTDQLNQTAVIPLQSRTCLCSLVVDRWTRPSPNPPFIPAAKASTLNPMYPRNILSALTPKPNNLQTHDLTKPCQKKHQSLKPGIQARDPKLSKQTNESLETHPLMQFRVHCREAAWLAQATLEDCCRDADRSQDQEAMPT